MQSREPIDLPLMQVNFKQGIAHQRALRHGWQDSDWIWAGRNNFKTEVLLARKCLGEMKQVLCPWGGAGLVLHVLSSISLPARGLLPLLLRVLHTMLPARIIPTARQTHSVPLRQEAALVWCLLQTAEQWRCTSRGRAVCQCCRRVPHCWVSLQGQLLTHLGQAGRERGAHSSRTFEVMSPCCPFASDPVCMRSRQGSSKGHLSDKGTVVADRDTRVGVAEINLFQQWLTMLPSLNFDFIFYAYIVFATASYPFLSAAAC